MPIYPSSIITDQCSSDEGVLAEDAEVPLVAAAFVFREAIYAFPNGSTKGEYRQWVQKMDEISVGFILVIGVYSLTPLV